MKILILNGPNINLLGLREPDIYGYDTYDDLLRCVQAAAVEMGIEVVCEQSNHEGVLVDLIQNAYGVFDGIIFNPAAYTHTSIALLDALKAVDIPTVEVHLSQIEDREAYRQRSYVREACLKTISGKGIVGYVEAMVYLKEVFSEK